MTASVKKIARICHEINRALCLQLGDHSQAEWDRAPQWQRNSCIQGVQFLQAHREAGPEASHENWMQEKVSQGWTFGTFKDVEAKTHPCLRPFADLPPEQQLKDALFHAVVRALS